MSREEKKKIYNKSNTYKDARDTAVSPYPQCSRPWEEVFKVGCPSYQKDMYGMKLIQSCGRS